MIQGRNIQAKSIGPDNMATAFDRYVIETKLGYVPMAAAGVGTGAAVGTTGALNLLHFREAIWSQHIKGAGQTIIVPVPEADGLEIALDKTDNEGAEYILASGVAAAAFPVTNPFAFTIGTDDSFFFRAKLKVADVSGTDEFLVGFRKNEASAAAHGTYTDYAALGMVAALGDIVTATDNDNAGETATDTTLDWADNATKDLLVRVDGAGAVQFFVNGARANSHVAFSFDATDIVIPFIFYLHATTTPGKVWLTEYECGFDRYRRP